MNNPFDILIVDDDLSWQDILKEIFEISKYTCDVAQNANSALDKITYGNYRLICMNWKIRTEAEGRDLIKSLLSKHPNLPIIVISGNLGATIDDIINRNNELNLKGRYSNVKNVFLKFDPENPDFIDKITYVVHNLIGESANVVTKIGDTVRSKKRKTISWLHLSDLHIADVSYDQDIVLSQLLEQLSKKSLNADCIFVTGDITRSGQKAEFLQAKRFLDKLLELLNLSKNKIFFVPGNHDIDWKKLNKLRNPGIKELLSNRERVNEFLLSNTADAREARKYNFNKFINYAEFVNSYMVDEQESSAYSFNVENYYYTKLLELGPIKIGVAGINSAWSSAVFFDFDTQKTHDEDHIILGEPQVRAIANSLQSYNADLNFVLMHHPFSFLEKYDREQNEYTIKKVANVILCGHLHETKTRYIIEQGTKTLVFQGGTTYTNRDDLNCCSFTQINLDSREGLTHPMRYTSRNGGRWIPDYESYPELVDEKTKFSLNFDN